jgi:hypothetical protein
MDENRGYWHALGMLRLDRPTGLQELEGQFASGSAPADLDGPMRGRLLATTFGHGIDGPFESIARLWMPWRGKELSTEAGEGHNLFTKGGIRVTRVMFPGYREAREDGSGLTAFRFTTQVAASETYPSTKVLQIDYRDLAENPSFPIRRILDELVQIDDDVYLGQALMLWRGRLQRAAWFSLEPHQPV